ncbi:hypothetical protein ACUY2Q_09270 [Corynebacterium bovis]
MYRDSAGAPELPPVRTYSRAAASGTSGRPAWTASFVSSGVAVGAAGADGPAVSSGAVWVAGAPGPEAAAGSAGADGPVRAGSGGRGTTSSNTGTAPNAGSSRRTDTRRENRWSG